MPLKGYSRATHYTLETSERMIENSKHALPVLTITMQILQLDVYVTSLLIPYHSQLLHSAGTTIWRKSTIPKKSQIIHARYKFTY